MTEKKSAFNPQDLERKIGALFEIWDTVGGSVRQRAGLDPMPLRLRLKGGNNGNASQAQVTQQNSPTGLGVTQRIGSLVGRVLPNRQQSQSGEPLPPQEDENSVEYWKWKKASDPKPRFEGTREFDDWEDRQMRYNNQIRRITGTPYLRGSASIARPDSGGLPPEEKEKLSGSVAK